jgi:hypothetical protein
MSERTLNVAPGVELRLRIPDDTEMLGILRLAYQLAANQVGPEELLMAMAKTVIVEEGAEPLARLVTLAGRYGDVVTIGATYTLLGLPIPTKYQRVGRGR